MGKILCATRGGEGSYRTQDVAIALARERGAQLVFLFVADTSFLDQTAAPLVVDIVSRLAQMGRFQLTLAQERAAEQGLAAETMLRRGRLRTELAAAAREIGATLIVLGRPSDEGAVFDNEALQSLAQALEEETGAEVRIL